MSIDPGLVQQMHNDLTDRQRQTLRRDRCLSDAVIDRYQVGVTTKFGEPRLTIPVFTDTGCCLDVRCWLHPKQRREGDSKIKPLETGTGEAKLFPQDSVLNDGVLLCAGEMDALAAISHDIPAITNTCGEGTWKDEFAVAFGGKRVTILLDQGEIANVTRRAESLSKEGAHVFIASWPDDRRTDWDVTDELREYDRDSLASIIDSAVAYEVDGSAEEESTPKETQAAALLALAGKHAELFHDQHDTPYARITAGKHRQIVRCRGVGFRRWLSRLAFEDNDWVPGSEPFSSALNVIEARACSGDQYELSNRVAASGGALWYDMGDGTAYRIDGTGYEHIDDPPILFASYAHQQAQAHPIAGGDLGHLLDFIEITDEAHRLLTMVWLVAALVPGIPHPILVYHGPQGSGKTSAARVLRSLADPSSLGTMSFPRDRNELVQKLAHHYVAPFDNIESLSLSQSDMLCRASTGEGFSKRQLYTDDEDVIYSYRRCVVLNGINIAATRADLLDRSILVGLNRISPENRKEETTLDSAFVEAKPLILGAMFDALSAAVRIRPEIKLASLPRMADFTRWGCAISVALGHDREDFLRAYQANISEQNREVLDGHPVAAAVVAFMSGESEWQGSPSALLTRLESVAEGLRLDLKARSWPKAPNVLSRRIREVQPNLAEVGIHVETGISIGHGRGIRICRNNIVGIVVSSKSNQCNNIEADDTETIPAASPEVSSVSKPLLANDLCDTDDADDTVGRRIGSI